MNAAATTAIRAKVNANQLPKRHRAAMASSGTDRFHIRAFSDISALRIRTRVDKKCFSSSLISDRITPTDLSSITGGPPESQSRTDQEPGSGSGEHSMAGIISAKLSQAIVDVVI